MLQRRQPRLITYLPEALAEGDEQRSQMRDMTAIHSHILVPSFVLAVERHLHGLR